MKGNKKQKHFAAAFLVVMMVASVLGVTAPIVSSTLVPPALEGEYLQTSGDNPLITSYTWTGNGDVVVDVVPFSHASNPSGTFTPLNIIVSPRV